MDNYLKNVYLSKNYPLKVSGFFCINNGTREVNTNVILASLNSLSQYILNILTLSKYIEGSFTLDDINMSNLSYKSLAPIVNKTYFASITINSIDRPDDGFNGLCDFYIINAEFMIGNTQNPNIIGDCQFRINIRKSSKL